MAANGRKGTKPARKAPGRPFTKDDPRINRTKPGPGRPPEEFKQLCRDMASGKLTMVALQAILEDRHDTKFVAALRYVTEYGYGKVAETVELTGKDGAPLIPQSIVIGGKTVVF